MSDIECARDMLEVVSKTYEQWLELFDASTDNGTWYELTLKNSLCRQLDVIEKLALNTNSSSLLDEARDLRRQIGVSLDEAVNEYTNMFIEFDDKGRYFEVMECLDIEPQIKYHIYCYIRRSKSSDGYGETNDILGFMDGCNHEWDDDCFHDIEFGGKFSDKMDDILEAIEDDFELECINSDNHNWQFYFTGDDKKLIRAIKNM